jgi:hypothetical protein
LWIDTNRLESCAVRIVHYLRCIWRKNHTASLKTTNIQSQLLVYSQGFDWERPHKGFNANIFQRASFNALKNSWNMWILFLHWEDISNWGPILAFSLHFLLFLYQIRSLRRQKNQTIQPSTWWNIWVSDWQVQIRCGISESSSSYHSIQHGKRSLLSVHAVSYFTWI